VNTNDYDPTELKFLTENSTNNNQTSSSNPDFDTTQRLEDEKLFDEEDDFLNSSDRLLKNAVGNAIMLLAQTGLNPNSILDSSLTANGAISKEIELTNSTLLDTPLIPNYFSQILQASKLYNKITSWVVRVDLIEIKNLVGSNENVFCIIEIGDQKYKTSVKQFDKLIYNEVNSP
jgi:hypothetical protein